MHQSVYQSTTACQHNLTSSRTLTFTCVIQEEQKFLQQRVETLQKELEIFADRSRHDMEQLKAELNSTQEVQFFLVSALLWHIYQLWTVWTSKTSFSVVIYPGVDLLRLLLSFACLRLAVAALSHDAGALSSHVHVYLPMAVMRGRLIAEYVYIDRNCGGRLLP